MPIEGDDNKVLTRLGCAFECVMEVEAANQLHHLVGVYTWVAVHVDEPQKIRQRTWLDVDKDLSSMGGAEACLLGVISSYYI